MHVTTYTAPPIVWALGAVTLIYLIAVGYFMHYLRRAHPETWTRLGRPSFGFETNSIVSFTLTGLYLLREEHRQLHDAKLSGLVWLVRALFVATIGLMIAAAHAGPGTYTTRLISSAAPVHADAPAPTHAAAPAGLSMPPIFFAAFCLVVALMVARWTVFGMITSHLLGAHPAAWLRLDSPRPFAMTRAQTRAVTAFLENEAASLDDPTLDRLLLWRVWVTRASTASVIGYFLVFLTLLWSQSPR